MLNIRQFPSDLEILWKKYLGGKLGGPREKLIFNNLLLPLLHGLHNSLRFVLSLAIYSLVCLGNLSCSLLCWRELPGALVKIPHSNKKEG